MSRIVQMGYPESLSMKNEWQKSRRAKKKGIQGLEGLKKGEGGMRDEERRWEDGMSEWNGGLREWR